MKVIREKEKPDLMIGLFRAGQGAFVMPDKYNESASLNVAESMPGFGMILMGHDHAKGYKKIVNVVGDSVLVIDLVSNGTVMSDIGATLKLKGGRVVSE